MPVYNKVIGFLCGSTSLGGLELNTVKRAVWLSNRGWKVYFFLVEKSPLEENLVGTEIERINIKRPRKYFDINNILLINRHIREKQIPVLYIRDNRDINLATFAKLFSGKRFKIIYHQAMQIGINKRDPFHTFEYSLIDAWLPTLPWLHNQVLERTKFKKRKLTIVPLGLELKKFLHNNLTSSEARKKLSLPEDKFLIGIIGRIDPGKGQDILIESIPFILKHIQNIMLLIVGDPTKNEGNNYMNHLQKLIDSRGISEQVIFHPFTTMPEYYYKAFDICAVPSLKETYGTVTIEAMASACPIVGSDSGGTAELLGNGEFGMLFQPGNAESFAKQVITLHHNKDKMNILASKAQKEASLKYSHETECMKIEQVIQKLVPLDELV